MRLPLLLLATTYLFVPAATTHFSAEDIKLERAEEEDGIGDAAYDGSGHSEHPATDRRSSAKSRTGSTKTPSQSTADGAPPIPPKHLEIAKAGSVRGFYTKEEMDELLTAPNPSLFCRHKVDPVNIWKDAERREENLIGKGGFGRVFKGVYTDTHQTPPKQHVVAVKYVAYVQKTAKSLLKEINFMRRMKISRHHLPFYQCYFERESDRRGKPDPNTQIIFMMALMNGDVDGLVRKQDRRSAFLKTTRYETFMVDMAKGIRDLHWMGIVHRDIKPDNFLISPANRPIVADLGLSEFVTPDGVSGVGGTPYYMAPEVVQKKRYGLPVDVFSLGVTFIAFLAGASPRQFVDFKLPDDSGLGKSVVFYHLVEKSRYLGLLQAMTDQSPDKRPKMEDVVADLVWIAQGNRSRFPVQPVVRPPPGFGQRRGLSRKQSGPLLVI